MCIFNRNFYNNRSRAISYFCFVFKDFTKPLLKYRHEKRIVYCLSGARVVERKGAGTDGNRVKSIFHAGNHARISCKNLQSARRGGNRSRRREDKHGRIFTKQSPASGIYKEFGGRGKRYDSRMQHGLRRQPFLDGVAPPSYRGARLQRHCHRRFDG